MSDPNFHVSARQRGTIRRVTSKLQQKPGVDIIWGVVTAVNTGPPKTVSLNLSGNTASVTKARYVKTYTPTVNDTVCCIYRNKDVFVIGPAA